MCNDYEQHIRWVQYCTVMQAAELGIPTQQSELDLPLTDDIKINDVGPVMRAKGNIIELVPMNFGYPPSGPALPLQAQSFGCAAVYKDFCSQSANNVVAGRAVKLSAARRL
jgi:hypothetical protein